ncbi:hypothetical protein E3P77_00597 [Wallemia ichthyophaga]|nr:hypothetical protein E3P77_00597 [Wallemia ichthyophaga]
MITHTQTLTLKGSAPAVQPPLFELNDGKHIPSIGYGTYKASAEEVYECVKKALHAGARHIDSAHCYGNGKSMADAIRDSGVPRQEIFITSKLWGTYHTRVEQGVDDIIAEMGEGIDYLDLLLMHYPVALNPDGNDKKYPTKPSGERDVLLDRKLEDTWEQLEDTVLSTNKVRSIGLSNCSKPKMETILGSPKLRLKPAVNQVEIHPYLPEHELVNYAKENNVLVQAYCPNGGSGSPVLTNPTLQHIAARHGANVGQVILSWLVLARGISAIPKSYNEERIKSNLVLTHLSQQEIDAIEAISKTHHQRNFKADWGPGVKMGFADYD